MSNQNSVTTLASSTALTSAVVVESFPVTDVPNGEALRANALVTFAAETLFQSGTTAQSMEIPLFTQKAGTFIPTRFIIQFAQDVVFGGGAAATATLLGTISLKTAGQTTVTSGAVVTTNNIHTTVSLVTAGGTGTDVLSTGQFVSTVPAFVSTNQMVIKPNQTLCFKFNSGGTVASDLTATGAFRVYVFGYEQP